MRMISTEAYPVPGVLQRGTLPRVVGGSHTDDLHQRTYRGPSRSAPRALGLALPGSRPAAGRRLTTNSRPTGEILGLTWQQVDFLNSRLTVGASKTDAGRGRSIPLNPHVQK